MKIGRSTYDTLGSNTPSTTYRLHLSHKEGILLDKLHQTFQSEEALRSCALELLTLSQIILISLANNPTKE